MKQILMGNEAIALALMHSNIQMISGYPGTPSSEIIANYQKLIAKYNIDAYAQWAANEKVGFEVAYAGAIVGKKACATMKQVGLNVASDALMSAAYIGNRGSMLLISADDPGFYSSQTEQDSRSFAKFAKIPVFDPATPQEAYDMTKTAVELSEKFQTIVMLRPVMRVCHAREICEVDENHAFESKDTEFQRDISRWAAVPRAGRFVQGIEQIERIEKLKKYNYEVFIEPKLKDLKGCKTLCLTSGTGDGYTRECLRETGVKADILKLDMPYPLPKYELEKLFEKYEQVVIFEESYPCIEEQLSSEKVRGKMTKDVHAIDEFTKEKVLQTFINTGLWNKENIYKNAHYDKKLSVRPPNLCPGCPHRDIYFAIKKTFREKSSIFPSDIGCYTLGLNQNAIDLVLCMGGSIGAASGFGIADPKKTVVATIGDSTFLHGGIPALINAVYQKHKFILIIMDNSTTAMTGRQTTPERANPSSIDIKRIVEGCGAVCFEYVYKPNIKETISFMKGLKKELESANRPIVAVMREFCVLDKERSKEFLPNKKAKVNQNKCIACNECISKYNCPAFRYNEAGKVEIDPFLCIGCTACIDGLCPTDAFELA
ncbi:MAG: indolepyruvate oxidoreductase [Campylobacteraceae bacterium]|jgi:indolepyruvate ferredoxin oxidoreductase alpha subunit|nr:indolepyruvate oxidoreductase [Campylobacteraceae bacterium]